MKVFNEKNLCITKKLLHQCFRYNKLMKTFTKIFNQYKELIFNIDVLVNNKYMRGSPTLYFMVIFFTKYAKLNTHPVSWLRIYCKHINFRGFCQMNIFAGINFHSLKKKKLAICSFKNQICVYYFSRFSLNHENSHNMYTANISTFTVVLI